MDMDDALTRLSFAPIDPLKPNVPLYQPVLSDVFQPRSSNRQDALKVIILATWLGGASASHRSLLPRLPSSIPISINPAHPHSIVRHNRQVVRQSASATGTSTAVSHIDIPIWRIIRRRPRAFAHVLARRL